MSTRAQQGYLLLADISGYTSFLADTEIEHAHEVMSELLELIIGQLTPTLTLAKLEGDAVFVYAPQPRLARGEILLELAEATYVAFRDRVTGMHRRTTCTCSACRAIPTLDLKFMAHYGTYIGQTVAGNSEVVGSDVNLVHRLLKNGVSAQTGWRAYALFSRACLEQIGLPPTGLAAGSESYEHLGTIETYSVDLRARYEELSAARHAFISPQEADAVLTYEFAAAPPVVWDWLNDPAKRNQWAPEVHWSVVARPGGRTGVGARNHCAHGKGGMTETVLDWRPFDYVTTRQEQGPMVMIVTSQLEPIATGTRLHYHVRMETRLPRWLMGPICRLMFNTVFNIRKSWANINRLLAEPTDASPAEARAA
ncbi:MAG TPA: DUF2652 domain-containing protein [Chloroflexia bacterium]|nr:DUF2652 domain-containing protein [Chloroflexia bacterium]